jgi:NAD-dependent dihydropyrimidine dehydrogenase PreA subunit
MTEKAGSGVGGQGSGNRNDCERERITVGFERAMVDHVTIFPETCTGCNRCVNICPVDLFLPSPERGGAPLVVFPGECWFEGSCVDICPEPGAIVLNRPFVSRVNWKLKSDTCVNYQIPRPGTADNENPSSGEDGADPARRGRQQALDSPED